MQSRNVGAESEDRELEVVTGVTSTWAFSDVQRAEGWKKVGRRMSKSTRFLTSANSQRFVCHKIQIRAELINSSRVAFYGNARRSCTDLKTGSEVYF